MKTSISNIAWPAKDDDVALDLVAELGFNGVEIAPVKAFGPLAEVDDAALRSFKASVSARGLAVSAMQGLLFGQKDVHLFESSAARARLGDALFRVAEIAEFLGARSCVFGAPTVRDPGELSPKAAREIAVEFFRMVGDRFAEAGTTLCIEANPQRYGCRFVTHTREAGDLVGEIGSAGIRMQLDMGTIFVNGESPSVIVETASVTGHVHVSEPDLLPVGSGSADHAPLASGLAASGYDRWLSVEMRQVDDWRASVTMARNLLDTVYMRTRNQ